MKATLFVFGSALLGVAALAQQPTKIAVINIQSALVSTRDGQKAAGELTARFEPRQKSLEGKQQDIASLQNELNKGSNTMAEARRISLTRDIDSKNKALQRDTQDAREEFEQEQNKILNDLGQKMMVIIDKYAKDNGYAVVIDVSSQQTPVLWAATSVDITKEIIDLYDKNSPSNLPAAKTAASPAATPIKPPSSPALSPVKKTPGVK